MNLQVLVSTMFQTDHTLFEKMNLKSDVIIINQCDKDKFEHFNYRGNHISFLSFQERGIGLSRNNALMRATADISLFADDDVIYVDNYYEKVIEAFEKNPEADMILFNVPSCNPNRPTYNITKPSRVRWYNCLRYGAVKIAIRTNKVKQANIYFSLLFGGGANFSSGEDSLFIAECIRKGLKVYTNPTVIGYVKQEESTWFNGYNNKYFIDKGVFFYCLSRRWAWILCLQFAIRHKELYKNNKSLYQVLKLMRKGMNSMKN